MNREIEDSFFKLRRICNETAVREGQVVVGLGDLRRVVGWVHEQGGGAATRTLSDAKAADYDAIVRLLATALKS